MAAPPEINLQNLNGVFVLNKTLSTDTDPVLALQGIGWIMRKAISIATVTLSVAESVEPNKDDPEHAPITRIIINQTATGGIKTVEKRTTDWRPREHTDRVFGTLEGYSKLIRASKSADGKVRPDVDVQTEPKDEKIVKYLTGEWGLEGSPEEEGWIVDEIQDGKDGVAYGEGEGLWLHSWVKAEAGWTAEQIWGFENVKGERRYTRRLAVAKDGTFLIGRLVYDYTGPVPAEQAEEDGLVY